MVTPKRITHRRLCGLGRDVVFLVTPFNTDGILEVHSDPAWEWEAREYSSRYSVQRVARRTGT